jgi:hypothetical protein
VTILQVFWLGVVTGLLWAALLCWAVTVLGWWLDRWRE